MRQVRNLIRDRLRRHPRDTRTAPFVAADDAGLASSRANKDLRAESPVPGHTRLSAGPRGSIPELSCSTRYLGSSMSSRLFQNVREKRGLAYAVNSSLVSYRDSGVLTDLRRLRHGSKMS